MTKPTCDPKRTGVKAVLIGGYRSGMEPGECFRSTPTHYHFACPGCGCLCGFRIGENAWQVTGGSLDDFSTLSVSPSLLVSCCGWHGYLRNGVFESC